MAVKSRKRFFYGLYKSGEEGGELAQAVVKALMRQDELKLEDGNELYEKLIEEFADVMAAQRFAFTHATPEFTKRVESRVMEKISAFQKRFAQ